MSSSPSSSDAFKNNAAAITQAVLGEPNRAHSSQTEWRYGTNGSLAVVIAGERAGTWHDHESGSGGGMLDLVQQRRNFDKASALDFIRSLGTEIPVMTSAPAKTAKPRIVKEYPYYDEQGEVLFRVVRYEPKTFRQFSGVTGFNKLGDTRRVLYRLPEILKSSSDDMVFIVEGEKDADNLVGQGLIATCNPMGADAGGRGTKWRSEYSDSLKGRHVAILADNDGPGKAHADAVIKSLRGRAASIRKIDLPGLPEKGDVTDWLNAGNTGDDLLRICRETPALQAKLPDSIHSALNPDADFGSIEITEDAIALEFTRLHKDNLRFDHTRGSWYHWNGTAWRRDETKLAFSWSRNVCRRKAKEAGLFGKQLASASKAAFASAVERFAQADQELSVTSAIWDKNPFLLGTPDGVLDLRSCQLRPASPQDHITKLTAVGPAPTPHCPNWLAFLEQATNGDKDLIRFLRSWCGYTLTGSTKEHALLFIYGPGGNGKSVFLNTLSGILGEYCKQSAMDTFTASPSDKHPTDLAMLQGARLVAASETDEGRSWAEARIKQMTGGDPISARFMRQDFFTYTPEFKLMVVGNHKPVLHNVDDAARRRFNIVPFIHKPTAPDRNLEEKLKAEWPAILRWMAEGCMDWQQNGLCRPKVVVEATAEYFETQDTFGQWLNERCVLDPQRSTKPSDLLKDFQEWCRENGEDISDNKRLRGMLERTTGIRYVRKRLGGTQVPLVMGISLLPKPQSQDRWN